MPAGDFTYLLRVSLGQNGDFISRMKGFLNGGLTVYEDIKE